METGISSDRQMLFEPIEEFFNLNKSQVLFANFLVKDLNRDYGVYDFI